MVVLHILSLFLLLHLQQTCKNFHLHQDPKQELPFAYIPRDHRYRQNTTDDERDAVFGSVQFQPNDRLDIMFDFQYSERDQREISLPDHYVG